MPIIINHLKKCLNPIFDYADKSESDNDLIAHLISKEAINQDTVIGDLPPKNFNIFGNQNEVIQSILNSEKSYIP